MNKYILKLAGLPSKTTWQIPCQWFTQRWRGASNFGLVNGTLTWKFLFVEVLRSLNCLKTGLQQILFYGFLDESLVSGRSVRILLLPMIRSVHYPWQNGILSASWSPQQGHTQTFSELLETPPCTRILLSVESPGTQATYFTSPSMPLGGNQGHGCWLLSSLARVSDVAGGRRVKPFRVHLRLCA